MLLFNPAAAFRNPLHPLDEKALDVRAAQEAERLFSFCPLYAPTPLVTLQSRANELGLGGLFVKDEGPRFGLGSFKALGGAFAVMDLVLSSAAVQLGRPVGPAELRTPGVRRVAADIVVACATDGNHGRSVAAGARLAGCRAEIFVHEGVSERRIKAIADLGANIVRVKGAYDDAVGHALSTCEQQGWHVLSDTSWPGYEHCPRKVMQGYTVMIREALKSMRVPPTHVFVQAGVGGLAAAVAGHLDAVFGVLAPRLIVVEPARAACLFESHRAGRRVAIARGKPTVMAMLECYEPSLVAWQILEARATAFMTIEEAEAVDAMVRLARPLPDDPAIVAGESGGVGFAGLLSVLNDERLCAALALDAGSRVLLFNTEGATDPFLYRKLTGIDPDSVGRAALLTRA